MHDLVKNVTEQLGLGSSTVSHYLYKLLMYEKGDFFASHRDTEKVDKMFATLIIALPSEHEGGELLVRHDGQEELIYFGGKDKHYQFQYAAFYADCEHEVKPVKHGYRCCLIYNLVLEDSKKQPLAPNNGKHVEQISKLIETRFEQESSKRMAVLLEHKYSEAGLSFENLKNADRMKVDVLLHAAKQAECEAHLAIVTRWESGWAEGGYGGYYNDDDYEMGEVDDWSLSVDHWIATDGKRKELGEINISEEDIVAEMNLEDMDADKQDVQEASGNAGATMERWYHRAALVIWPQRLNFYQLCQAGQHSAILQLKQMLTAGPATNIEQCQEFATEIINEWKLPNYHVVDEDYADAKTMFDLLIKIGSVKLLEQFLKNILTQILSGKEAKAIIKICKQYGWLSFQSELALMAEQQKTIIAFISVFEELCADTEESERLKLCKSLTPKVIATLKQSDNKNEESRWAAPNPPKKPSTLISFFKSLYRINETKRLATAVTYFISDTTHYPLHSCLIPTVKKLSPWFAKQTKASASFKRLEKYCIDELKARTAEIVVYPTDWKQDISLSCSCADCEELQQFLLNPSEKAHNFRVKKERRQHLHQQIDGHKCNMSHQTTRTGSPYTLVCTKNYSSYDKRQTQWELDKKLLKELQKLG
jgi:hypothetical protein